MSGSNGPFTKTTHLPTVPIHGQPAAPATETPAAAPEAVLGLLQHTQAQVEETLGLQAEIVQALARLLMTSESSTDDLGTVAPRLQRIEEQIEKLTTAFELPEHPGETPQSLSAQLAKVDAAIPTMTSEFSKLRERVQDGLNKALQHQTLLRKEANEHKQALKIALAPSKKFWAEYAAAALLLLILAMVGGWLGGWFAVASYKKALLEPPPAIDRATSEAPAPGR